MSTFTSNRGAEYMFASVGDMVTSIEMSEPAVDVHTVTVVLNGQHGEFDLTIEGSDMKSGFMEERKWTGVVYRSGGVMDFQEVTA